jgi:hypothetical protein
MGQKNSLLMVDPATWSTRAVQLHIACGKGIVLSEEGSVAQRKDATRQPKDGLVHTAWPIAVGRLFQVTILETVDKWSGSMGIGFTTISPAEYNVIPSSAVSRPLETSPCHWLLWGTTLRHKKKRKRFADLTLLREGQTVGCLVTQTGELHFFVDGRHVGKGWSGLPVDKPLWGLADVYGKCSKIRAQVLSDVRMTSSSTSHPYWPTEIMVDRQLTETTHELVKAKDSLEQKDSLIQQLKDQINQMDSEIQELQTTIAGRLPRGEYSHSTDLDRDDQGTWYL